LLLRAAILFRKPLALHAVCEQAVSDPIWITS
jgi:hypothetical protein